MQKISPLKSSLEAFKKFKINRSEAKNNNNINATNPFGITFKGTVLQMDVFESSTKKSSENLIQDKMNSAGKFLASAWSGTINKFSSVKENLISFTGAVKNNAKLLMDKLNTEITFDFMKYNVGSLQTRPVSELGEMLSTELKALEV